MSDDEIGGQICKTLDERREAVRKLAAINARMTSLGRRLAEIGKALESGAPQGTDDPLLWQLRDLEGDIAAVLNPDLLRTIVEDRGRLQKLVDQLTAYLLDMGINPV